MLKTKEKQSLSEKISDKLIADGPKTFDSDDEHEETKAIIVDEYSESDSDDGQTGTSFRKQNVHLLDEVDARYKGKKVSRKDIYKSSDDGVDDESMEDSDEALEDLCNINSDDEPNHNDNEDTVNDKNDDDNVDEDDCSSEEVYSDYEEESDFDESNPLRWNHDGKDILPSMTPKNVYQEAEKGTSVRNQLKLWENMLEMRIKLQKCLSASNKMPQHKSIQEFRAHKQYIEAAEDTKNKLSNALENLIKLQEKLWKNNSETKNLLSKNKKNDEATTEKDDPMDTEIPSDTDEENIEGDDNKESDSDDEQPANKKRITLAEFEKILDERHMLYRSYRNSVIQKWNDKTRVATGNANNGTSQAVVKQIEFLLNDKQKLITRTQLKRSEYSIVGKVDEARIDEDGRRIQEYDTEIYDDDDFYHQLLRELIEHKSADITDPIQLSKQWIQLQNMRNKMKRKIDTRATKGRRVRYNVHTKLVNYMAPNAIIDTWSDLAKTELYNSLFGKVKVIQNTPRPDVEQNIEA